MKIGEYLLARNCHAATAAFICTLLPLIYLPGGFFAAIIVGLVTLQKGAKPGLEILAWVALPALALLYLHSFGTFDVLLFRGILVWGFAALLRTYCSWRLVLEVAVIVGIVLVVIMHLWLPDVKVWWIQLATRFFSDNKLAESWRLAANDLQGLIQAIAPFATGLMCFLLLLGTALQLFLARWWQAALYNNADRLRKEYLNLHFSWPFSVLTAMVMLGALLKVTVLVDLFPLMLLPFMLAGLSLLHWWMVMKKGLFIPVILVYVGLLFATLYMVALLAIVGFVDSWYDFRQKVR